MTQTLQEAALHAGLQDMDLLRLAPEGVKPSIAIADLQHRFPTAFRPVVAVRDMTRAEYAAAREKMVNAPPPPPPPVVFDKDARAMSREEYLAARAVIAGRPGSTF